ncbi:winged helix-turn-helix transcriptional regulator [Candidatus Altiarchaeota archaeon]
MESDESFDAICPIGKTVSLIGKKWSLLILKELYCRGPNLRFNQLKKNLGQVTSAILSKRLKELEAEGIVHRKVLTSDPPLKVEYCLTEKGCTLQDILLCMRDWGQHYSGASPEKLKSCEDCQKSKKDMRGGSLI